MVNVDLQHVRVLHMVIFVTVTEVDFESGLLTYIVFMIKDRDMSCNPLHNNKFQQNRIIRIFIIFRVMKRKLFIFNNCLFYTYTIATRSRFHTEVIKILGFPLL